MTMPALPGRAAGPGPMTAPLAGLARGGPAVQFAAGTGPVALALSARAIAVHGIERSGPLAGGCPPRPAPARSR